MVQTAPTTGPSPLLAQGGSTPVSQCCDERLYQVMTVAAILLILGSLWAF